MKIGGVKGKLSEIKIVGKEEKTFRINIRKKGDVVLLSLHPCYCKLMQGLFLDFPLIAMGIIALFNKI